MILVAVKSKRTGRNEIYTPKQLAESHRFPKGLYEFNTFVFTGEHYWHECFSIDGSCFTCEGGLSHCIICNQAEGTLEETCPGHGMENIK